MVRGVTTNSRHPVALAPRHAAIYTRISDDKEGDELGVTRQLEDCETKAEREGYTVVARFSDNDISASTKSKKHRPEYADMLDRARAGEFGTIIAYSNSRITRRPRELEDLIVLFERFGTVVRTVVSGDDDLSTADGRMTARIKAAVDAAEAERIGERVERAARQRVESGKWHGGVPPFGFRKENKTLIVDDREAEMIREAAARVLDHGETLYGIVKDWNARGDLTRKGTAWKRSVLRNVLVNPALVGTNSAGVENCWTPILNAQTHARLVDRFAPDSSRRTNPLGVKGSKYALGGGLIRCARCGLPLYPVAREGQRTRLVCRASANGDHKNHPKREDGTSEGRVSIDSDALEAYLMDRCREHLNDNPFWEPVKRKRETAESDTSRLRAERDTRQGERDRAGRAFVAGIMSEGEAHAEVARLDAEIARLTERIERADGGPTAQEVWAGREEVLDLWKHWTPGELRLFLRSMIARVVVGDWPRGVATRNTTDSEKRDEAMRSRVDIEWLG